MPYFQRKVYVLSNILSIFIFIFPQEEGMCSVVKVTKLFFLHVSLKAFYDRLHVLYIIYLYTVLLFTGEKNLYCGRWNWHVFPRKKVCVMFMVCVMFFLHQSHPSYDIKKKKLLEMFVGFILNPKFNKLS